MVEIDHPKLLFRKGLERLVQILLCMGPVDDLGDFQTGPARFSEQLRDTLPYPWSAVSDNNDFGRLFHAQAGKIMLQQLQKSAEFSRGSVHERMHVFDDFALLVDRINTEQLRLNPVRMETSAFGSGGQGTPFVFFRCLSRPPSTESRTRRFLRGAASPELRRRSTLDNESTGPISPVIFRSLFGLNSIPSCLRIREAVSNEGVRTAN